tara:strand:- start:23234 stop:25693 length:2460 start_codon:yes stop_codon:yes gene_type:complete
MAKIENITVYPTVLPAASDLLIATDVSDDNKTVTFLVSDLLAAGTVLQDLQSVLTTGNTAIESINLTGNINVTGTVYPTTITAVGSTGAAGQILSSTGTGIQWINSPSVSCCSLDDVLTVGNTTSQDIVMTSGQLQVSGVGGGVVITTPGFLTNSGISTFSGQVNINSTALNFNATGTINDGLGSVGLAGQVLTSTGTGVQWSSSAASCCTLQDTLAAGNTAANVGITFSGTSVTTFGASNNITSAGTNTWSGNNTFSATGNLATTAGIALTGTLWDGTSIGTAGQVLTSTVTGVQWAAASGGSQNLQQVLDIGNTATQSITLTGDLQATTFTDLSGSTGTPGQVLSSTGGGLQWVNSITSCCSLDDTLLVGNTSAQSITLTGAAFVTAPFGDFNQLTDGASFGAAGEVLSSTGSGLAWIAAPGTGVTSIIAGAGIAVSSPTGAVTITNTGPGTGTVTSVSFASTIAGLTATTATATTTPALTLSITGVPPVTEYLDGTGNWSVPSVPGGAVTNVGLGALALSTGAPLDISPTTGSVVITPKRYDGGVNEGFVPQGGSATTFLRGDGQWVTPTGTGGLVSSVSAGATGTSTGVPITIAPTTGVVVVNSNAYNGGANIGHVPAAGTAGNYLEGNGTWSVPTQQRTYFSVNRAFCIGNGMLAQPYMTFGNINQTTTFGLNSPNQLDFSSANAPSAGGWTIAELTAGIVNQNEGASCGGGTAEATLCSVSFSFIGTGAATYYANIWKIDPCDSSYVPMQAARCELTGIDKNTPMCCTASLTITGQKLIDNEAHMFTFGDLTASTSWQVQGNMVLKYEYTGPF